MIDLKSRFRGVTEVFVFLLIVGIVLFGVRVLLMLRILDWSTVVDNVDSIPLMIFNAVRYDMQVAAYTVLPLYVLALVHLFVGNKIEKVVAKFSKIYTIVVVVLITLIDIGDIQFYANFNQHYNIVAFDFFDENPLVLVSGIIKEFSVVLIVVGVVMSVLLLVYGRRALYMILDRFNERKSVKIALVVALFLLVPIAIRGSLGTFPLRAEDTYVSSSSAINDCVPNGLFMLKKAWSEKNKQFVIQSEEDILHMYGFETESEAIKALCEVRSDSADKVNIEDVLYGTTPKEVIAKSYNVLFIIMESWSNRLIDYESYIDSDLLCGLNNHFREDYLFRNFVSVANGTIDAVEFLTVNAIHPRLFTSRYRTCEYPTATAKIWHDAGYETSFVSGIEISWRNLIEVLPLQGFDRVMGKYELLKERPEAEYNKTWGVYDHEMLSYLNDYLNANDRPKFVMALTSTSHTPFEFPDHYQFPDIRLSDNSRELFATSDDVTLEYLKGYQYENMALCRFLDDFKASQAADSTIVVVTGDHNIRQILAYNDINEQWKKYSVPLYVYLPDDLRDKVSYDSQRYGGHHDIVPTLASMTVAEASYFNTGNNLFEEDSSYLYHGANRELIIYQDDEKADVINRFVSARRALTKIYFQRLWNSNR